MTIDNPHSHLNKGFPSCTMRSFFPTVTTIDPNSSRLSVHQTLLQYPLVQLQVHPLRLSTAHLRLLGCAFVDTSPSDRDRHHTPPPPPPETETKESRQSPSSVAILSPKEPSSPLLVPTNGDSSHVTNCTITKACTPPPGLLLMTKPPAQERWARRIALCDMLAGKQTAMMSLLESSPIAAKQSRTAVPFRYRAFKEPVLGIAFETLSEYSTVPGPSIIYLDASDIRASREEHLRNLYLQYFSQEKKRLYQSHLGQLAADIAPCRDPYMAVMLIALAQAQRRAVQSRDRSPPPAEQAFRAHVLVSDVNDKSCLRVYTAQVPDAFLDKLVYPRLPPVRDTSFRIYHTTVPYEPYSSFRHRLTHAMSTHDKNQTRGCDENEGILHEGRRKIGKRARGIDEDENILHEGRRWQMGSPHGHKRLRTG
ncbi:hypothetical protein BDP55DRAFT_422299 [Colletotrichum godetiae]|uniref:Uncharacterized protein n=1 Tax=Colletotrichum godetiae TaxID=1209918 RepID=A0AAJ0A705_9PEZI|nr:uncharacterized protein BDP55DRAFT_422299 [Colletotrichum godetiae]KAK1657650.1 hypothetical protein BDP55DRAFT_422299 [Colletotrichum godetiae]